MFDLLYLEILAFLCYVRSFLNGIRCKARFPSHAH